MTRRSRLQALGLTSCLLVGLLAGLLASFWAWPVTCAGASPADLDLAGKRGWLIAAAASYSVDRDLSRAGDRVLAVGADGLVLLCGLASEGCGGCSEAEEVAVRELAEALGLDCSPAAE